MAIHDGKEGQIAQLSARQWGCSAHPGIALHDGLCMAILDGLVGRYDVGVVPAHHARRSCYADARLVGAKPTRDLGWREGLNDATLGGARGAANVDGETDGRRANEAAEDAPRGFRRWRF